MSTTLNTTRAQSLPSIQVQAFATCGAVAGAVALPQIFHAVGAVSGMGTGLGEAFLPMHLPILLVGLLAGPYAGAVAGALAPLASFVLSGMPVAAMVPFMMIELAVYGLSMGLLRNTSMPTIGKVFIAQIAGRVVRAAAILIGVYAFGSTVAVATIWTSLASGLPGLILQWGLIPLIMFWVNNRSTQHNQ